MERICTSFFEKTNKQKMLVERTRKKILPFLRWETFLIQTVKEFLLCLKNVTYSMWCVSV